jgi:transglutaminase-like putative cysteine protease
MTPLVGTARVCECPGTLMTQTHRFSIETTLRYQLNTDGWLLLNMAACQIPTQRVVRETIANSSGNAFREQVARDGATRFHGLTVPAGELTITYSAEVERDFHVSDRPWTPHESLLVDFPPEVARYLYPSRYCESDKLVRLAAKEFGHLTPGHEKVVGVCNWIHNHIDYECGVTNAHTSAVDCLTLRAGVCRDFAHLGVAFCRALGIPARYGSAYAFDLTPPDFHAFFEVWLEGQWWYYDATRLAPQPGFILIGTGHDAADTSVATMSAGIQFVSMDIKIENLGSERVEYTVNPVTFHPRLIH